MAGYEGGPTPYDKRVAAKPTGLSSHNLTMQTRVCTGGCGKEFKCLASSKQTRAFGDCETRCKQEVPTDETPMIKDAGEAQVIELHDYATPKEKVKPTMGEYIANQPMGKKAKEIHERKEALKAESRKRLAEKKLAKTPTKKSSKPKQTNKVAQRVKSEIKGYDRQKNAESKWKELVNKAKAKIKTMHRARMEVAGWAMEACDIHWGGGDHWTGHKNVKTMKAFATEIGVSYKTLAQWVRVKRNVHDKLPPGVWQDDKYMIAMRTSKKIKRNAKPKDVMQVYLKELERKDDALILQQANKRMSTMHYFIHQKIRWEEVDREELVELRDYCADIMDRINLEIGEKYERPEDAEFNMDES
jgi:hypothetical protein